jgi:hypothetical protein
LASTFVQTDAVNPYLESFMREMGEEAEETFWMPTMGPGVSSCGRVRM